MPEQSDTLVRDRLARQRTELANERTCCRTSELPGVFSWNSGRVVAGGGRISSAGCGLAGHGHVVPGGRGLAIRDHQSGDQSTTGLVVWRLDPLHRRQGFDCMQPVRHTNGRKCYEAELDA